MKTRNAFKRRSYRILTAWLPSSPEELITRDHCRPMRTLVQEMNISIKNKVRNTVSFVIRRGQSCSEASKRMQNWLQEVWDKEVWPPSSPDYSLLDYFVLGVSEL
jgi:hypothetical protein